MKMRWVIPVLVSHLAVCFASQSLYSVHSRSVDVKGWEADSEALFQADPGSGFVVHGRSDKSTGRSVAFIAKGSITLVILFLLLRCTASIFALSQPSSPRERRLAEKNPCDVTVSSERCSVIRAAARGVWIHIGSTSSSKVVEDRSSINRICKWGYETDAFSLD